MVKLFARIAARLRALGYAGSVASEPKDSGDPYQLEVALPKELRAFVDAQAAHEGFASGAEYVQELVRRAQAEAEGHDEELEKLLLEGLNSGPGIVATPEYWARMERELTEKHRGKAAE